jgi:small subunit ribosomal protein S6
MPTYELVVVARKTNFASLLKRYGETVLGAGGVLRRIESLGTRRLAYPMQAHQQTHLTGRYLRVEFEGAPTLPRELDRRLKIDEDVIRHMLVRSNGFATSSAESVGRPKPRFDERASSAEEVQDAVVAPTASSSSSTPAPAQ